MAASLPTSPAAPGCDGRGRGHRAGVPTNLGYAGIAGIPLQNGLYAAAAGAIIYALFCTSRHISTGPSSSLAAVAGGAVLATGLDGSAAAQLVAAIALATGVLFLLFAAFRLGWIASSCRGPS
jgi:sulfate permease, SulP family